MIPNHQSGNSNGHAAAEGKTEHARNDLSVFNEHESEVRSYVRSFPTVFEKARGSHLIDETGRVYIDFFSGAGALNYGHNNPKIKEGLLEYLSGDGITHSLDMATEAKRDFITTFRDVILKPRHLDHKLLFPGPTGTNAVEAALKVARKAKKRTFVWGFQGGFHGMTIGSLAITANKMKRGGAGMPLCHTRLLPFDGEEVNGVESLEYIESQLKIAKESHSLPAAIALETVQCEGGVRVASSGWLRRISELCREYDVVFIVDDIQAGCGRTGRFFSFEEAGVVPDIICLSKSLSGLGIPFAVVLLRPGLDVFQPGEHNGTFRGHNLAFITATRALEFWADPAFQRMVEAKGLLLRDRLEKMVENVDGAHVRGRGLVQGIVFEDESLPGKIGGACFERGVVIETAGPNDEVLKFLPALTMDVALLEKGLDVVAEAMEAVVPQMTLTTGGDV